MNQTASRSAAALAFAVTCILVVGGFTGGPNLAGEMGLLALGVLVGAVAYSVAEARNVAYRFAVGLAFVSVLLLIWLSLRVGLIGRDGDPANLMYGGVLAVGIVGALAARFRPRGMARAMVAMAVAQALVGGIALVGRMGRPWSGPAEIVFLNGFFVALFVGSAWLFRRAARGGAEPGAA